ncbi:MAG: N-acetylneuraminate synthase family protein [Elusimicrobia bacterium]|nr:N-acetylneuraminate synthase family protein [Elusimicrobiota bacterium]
MKPIFVAEIGMNADGNFDMNYELIRQAAWAGADVAKFQVGWRWAKEEINFLDEERLRALKKWCSQFGVEFMASIIVPEAWALVKKVGMDRYKIASRTVKDYPDLCREIIRDGRETFVSLGMYEGKDFPFPEPNVRYLYCVSKYPARYEDLAAFPAAFDRYFGYSDHLMGIEGCLLALSRGARLVEKHFTLNKTSKVIRDHSLSATPEEFRQLVRLGGDVYALSAALRERKA